MVKLLFGRFITNRGRTSNPEELLELQSIFKKFGAVFVFSDGSGSLSLSNIRSGRGVTNSRMV